MGKTIVYPLGDSVSITLPDEFLGKHLRRYDEAREKALEAGLPALLAEFAVSLAILEDWQIPSLPANPEEWTFADVEIKVMAWVSDVVLEEYDKASEVPKNSSAPLSDG